MSLRNWLLKKLAGDKTVIINAKITGQVHCPPQQGGIFINMELTAPPGDRQTRYDVIKMSNFNFS